MAFKSFKFKLNYKITRGFNQKRCIMNKFIPGVHLQDLQYRILYIYCTVFSNMCLHYLQPMCTVYLICTVLQLHCTIVQLNSRLYYILYYCFFKHVSPLPPAYVYNIFNLYSSTVTLYNCTVELQTLLHLILLLSPTCVSITSSLQCTSCTLD